jgi:hypothetical protein
MKTSASILTPHDHPVATEAASWHLHIVAMDEPLLLARVLQKLAVPEIGLRAVHFETGGPGGEARVALTFAAHPARARLAAVRVQKIIGVQALKLDRADG